MPLWRTLTLIVLLLPLLAACRLLAPPPAPPVSPAAALPTPAASPAPGVAIPVETTLSGERAWRTVEYLAGTIGPRPAGSAGYQRAANWAAEQFRVLGYRVERQPFSFEEFRVRQREVRVLAPTPAELDAVVMTNSGNGEVSGPLVAAGLGRPEEFPSAAAGAVVLIERGVIPFQEKVANAVAAGAGAVVVFNSEPGLIQPLLSTPAVVPAVFIRREDGLRLRDQLAQEAVLLRVVVRAERMTIASENVIATRPGRSEKALVVGAHLDSVEGGPGANDNASGVALTLELARVLAATPTAAELRFILFGAEENGLIGSQAYVQQLSESEVGRIVGMVNLDMVGIEVRLTAAGASGLSVPAREKAAELGRNLPESPNGGAGSDHASFARRGIPTLFLFTGIDDNYHQPTDLPQFVQPETLHLIGEIALHVIRTVAG
ncbi:MAG: M20/M25/M40 family metallo-hydrolase [Chloroflexi bacterium]|nr:M20/M25/M40 family metallo-hydrolase [Chloroflexota bacterium]